MPEMLHRAASVAPTTVNEAARTVGVIWSTGARVARRTYEGPFVEVLSLNPAHVDLTHLRGGSVLDSHQRGELRHVLGIVDSADVDGREGRAVLRFSTRPDVAPIWEDVRAGTIRHVSVGYTVETWKDEVHPDTGERTRTAIAWTPREISLVPVPADSGATVRAEGDPMPDTTPATGTPTTVATPPPAALQARAEINQAIRGLATTAGLDAAFADGQIDRGATVEQAREAAFQALIGRGAPLRTEQPPHVQVGVSHDDPAARCGWMGEALYARTNPTHQLSDPARQYAYLSMAEMARESLRLRGLSTTGLPAVLISRSLHTTSDFSVILGDTVNRTLRAAYEAAPSGIKRVARQTTAKDFRAKTRIMLGEAPTLEKVNEHGEFKSGTMAEAKETYKVDTFGRIIGITRQAIVNDDLGAFTDLSARLGIAASQFEAQFLVDLLVRNSGDGPTMDDGNTLFHASHGNKAGSGGSVQIASLSAGRLAMRKQVGLSGQLISVTPKYLLVPADQETLAEQVVAIIHAATTDDVNPFTSIMPIVEPRLTSGVRWYLVAADVDGLEYAYLEGAPGPQTESRNGFEVDGVQVKVRLDFGAGFVDWRGWYANAGA